MNRRVEEPFNGSASGNSTARVASYIIIGFKQRYTTEVARQRCVMLFLVAVISALLNSVAKN